MNRTKTNLKLAAALCAAVLATLSPTVEATADLVGVVARSGQVVDGWMISTQPGALDNLGNASFRANLTRPGESRNGVVASEAGQLRIVAIEGVTTVGGIVLATVGYPLRDDLGTTWFQSRTSSQQPDVVRSLGSGVTDLPLPVGSAAPGFPADRFVSGPSTNSPQFDVSRTGRAVISANVLTSAGTTVRNAGYRVEPDSGPELMPDDLNATSGFAQISPGGTIARVSTTNLTAQTRINVLPAGATEPLRVQEFGSPIPGTNIFISAIGTEFNFQNRQIALSVNDGGTLAYFARFVTSTDGLNVREGFFSQTAAAGRLLVQFGTQAPGLPTGTVISSTANVNGGRTTPPLISNSGVLGFDAQVTGAITRSVAFGGTATGTVSALLPPGSAPSGVPVGRTVTNTSLAWIGDDGRFLIDANYSSLPTDTLTNKVLLFGSSDSPVGWLRVFGTGDQIDLGDGVLLTVRDYTLRPDIIGSGSSSRGSELVNDQGLVMLWVSFSESSGNALITVRVPGPGASVLVCLAGLCAARRHRASSSLKTCPARA